MSKRTLQNVATIAIAAALALPLAACGTDQTKEAGEVDVVPQGEQIPDPFQTFDTLEEAEEAVGFEIQLPNPPEDSFGTVYRADAESDLIEVIYQVGDAEVAWEAYRIRKGVGADDVSGDYTDYPEVSQEQVGAAAVTLKGEGGRVVLATWTDGDHSYSVSVAPDGPFASGMAKEDILGLVGAIR